MSKNFTKNDQSKLRMRLLPIEALEKLCEVLEYGAQKYSEENWRECEDLMRYYDAALRHLFAWKKGERCDEESQCQHLAHAMACITFLVALDGKES